MARIRTIKPEFPHSESLGRVSRDARLTFVLLWTLADDEGRLRGNSRMLASLLFPYDEDAGTEIDDWLSSLECEGCIRRYVVDGQAYIDIPKWLDHQKIDRPSKSKIPGFIEHSTSAREDSRIVGVGVDQGVDQGMDQNKAPAKPSRFDPESLSMPLGLKAAKWSEWIDYRRKRRLSTTEPTARKQLAMLEACIARGFDAGQIIDTSIEKGWQGLFEPKARGSPNESRSEERAKVGDILTGRSGHERTGNYERDITGECERVA